MSVLRSKGMELSPIQGPWMCRGIPFLHVWHSDMELVGLYLILESDPLISCFEVMKEPAEGNVGLQKGHFEAKR